MSLEPDGRVLHLLRDMRAELGDMRADVVTKADLRSEVHSSRADVATEVIEFRRNIVGVRKEISDQVVGLRRAEIAYHTSVIGHGVLISEREARLRGVERHLDLPPHDAH